MPDHNARSKYFRLGFHIPDSVIYPVTRPGMNIVSQPCTDFPPLFHQAMPNIGEKSAAGCVSSYIEFLR